MAQCPYSIFEYTVRSGDTPAAIARRFGLGARELAQLDTLIPGHTVKIFCPAGACPCGAFYMIQRGDTLRRIAKRSELPLKQLLAANPYLNPARYMPGQVVIIPARRSGAGTYTLAEGERLFDALRRLHIDITTFCGLNPGIKPMDVRPGQTINIPRDIPGGEC
jgi:spore germination protein YaaH